MLRWVMHPRVAQFLAAIVVLSAAWLMPSLASAHAGHSHHAGAATEMTVAPPAKLTDAPPTTVARSEALHHTEVARAATIASIDGAAIDGEGCASHCCGATGGMTCCGAALAPEIAIGPALAGSQVLSFGHASALLGQPPEALPKPPKSFA
jgi:hypothetical protein